MRHFWNIFKGLTEKREFLLNIFSWTNRALIVELKKKIFFLGQIELQNIGFLRRSFQELSVQLNVKFKRWIFNNIFEVLKV